jgi:chorismate mutase/prephenate dehydratase
MNIQENRAAIDKIDAQIVKLLNRRTKHVLNIGQAKLASGKAIFQPDREQALLRRICKLSDGILSDESLRHIYREVMSSSIALQKGFKIAFLGPEATYTHQAAVRRFGTSLAYVPQKTISEVFSEVEKDRAEYGVVPVENTTEGVVTHTLDMFVDSELKIVAQIVMPIEHCLVGKGSLKQAKKLYSHPQAYAQCRNWVRETLPSVEFIETSSTTAAAALAARAKTAVAISSALAAEKYKLNILDAAIQDHSGNATRFLVLGRICGSPTGHDRTSLMFTVNDKVGALHDALQPFRTHRLNMTKIESRPSKRKAWEYIFFVDVDGHSDDPKLAKAIGKLSEKCSFVKILGSYPYGD